MDEMPGLLPNAPIKRAILYGFLLSNSGRMFVFPDRLPLYDIKSHLNLVIVIRLVVP